MKPFYYMEYDQRNYFTFYGRNGNWIERPKIKPYCFVEAGKTDTVDRRCAETDKPLTKQQYEYPEDINDIKNDEPTWEGDLSFERRYMMDLDLRIGDVPICYMDIETDDTDGASDPDVHEIISIAMLFDDGREVFLSKYDYTESEMLDKFIKLMENIGMIVTWNGGEDIWETFSFDMPYLGKRYHSQHKFDYALKHCMFFDLMRRYKNHKTNIGQGLAGGYSLNNVSQVEVGAEKVYHTKKISEMTKEELREYNMQDVRLLKQINDKYKLTDLSISIAQVCNLRLTDWRRNKKRSEITPLKQIDNLFIKECQKENVAWVTPVYKQQGNNETLTGAGVLEPTIGLHYNVQNMDVKSMYPSIMINERYSPDKDRKLIPNLLKTVLTKRVEYKTKYKETGEQKYDMWQYAYKVVANTAYGVMSNVGFRGYNLKIAQAITTKGKALLGQIKEHAESVGFEVIYGDTDSIFVKAGDGDVEGLLKIINRRISPYILDMGESYKSILFTGDNLGGKKKRYAGIMNDDKLKVKGLEAVRGDYTVMAREIQLLILTKLLSGISIDDCKKCLKNLKSKIFMGDYDEWLMQTSGVKPLDEYAKTDKNGRKRGFPPHVRALEMAYNLGHTSLNEINYYFTTDDVVPSINGSIPDNIDYDHYFEKQVMGVVRNFFESINIQNGGLQNQSRKKKIASEECTSLLQWS